MSKRKSLILRRGAVAIAGATALLVAPAQPVFAATTLDEGNGAFVATTALDPTIPCAIYSNYEVTMAFDSATDPFGSFSGPYDVTAKSTVPAAWGEFADGTYQNIDCTNGPGYAVPGFAGEVVGSGGTCVLTDGTYSRNGTRPGWEGMDIVYEFATVTGPGCPAGPLTIKTTITDTLGNPWGSDCNSPIAPQTCRLGPAGF